MRALRFLFSPSGRLGPQAFAFGVVAVYAAGVVSQWLTAPSIMIHSGVWPFAVIQILLIWIWFSLHAKRLHDADCSVGPPAAASILYFLALILLLFLLETFFGDNLMRSNDPNTTSALTLILFIWIVAILSDAPSSNFYWLGVLVFVGAVLPIVLAMAVTLWAATRRSIEEPTT